MRHNEIDKKIKGDRLRIALVESEEGGLFLKIALADWGGTERSFFTATPFLVVNRAKDGSQIPALSVELSIECGSEPVTLPEHVRSEYCVFDVRNVWEELGQTPMDDITRAELVPILERQITWRER